MQDEGIQTSMKILTFLFPLSLPPPSHTQLIPLQKQTNEYNEVSGFFAKTMDSNRIKRIQRIQNLDLWEFYCR